ncbi:MAG: glycosyltransferase family 4 protein [Promethearchaeota archaeon]
MRIGLISSGTITDRIPPIFGGGIQKYLWNLGRELSRLGHEVHVFTQQQPFQLKEEILNDIYIHRISRVLNSKILVTIIFGFKTLLKILKIQKTQGAFDVIHAQSRISGFIIRSFLRRIPFVFTAHNWDIALTSTGSVVSPFPYAILRLIEKRVYSQCNKIIVLTNFFQRILVNRYKISSTKILIVPNMINIYKNKEELNALHPLIIKIASKPFLIFIGRLEREKGCEYLLNAFRIIVKQDRNLQLVMVGNGSLKSVLKQMEIRLNLTNQVHILGNLHETQLLYLLKRAKALILPSQFEIMPTVILEAWAAGCPVIVREFYGVQALIRHKHTGLLFQKNQFFRLPLIVHELLNNRNLRQSLIQNSKMQVKFNYNSARVAEKILDIYKNMLNR